MKNKKLKQCLLTLMSGVLAVTVLGGCGSSNDEATAGEAGTKEAAQTTSSENGVVLTYAGNQPVETLDRFNQYDTADFTIGLLWGDALMEADHLGNYEPWLASDISLAEDSMSCTFK